MKLTDIARLANVSVTTASYVLNGKAGALGMIIAAANTAMVALSMDGFAFVLRGWYLFVVMFLLAARHLAFNANPMLTSADLLEKERKRAEKAAAKAS